MSDISRKDFFKLLGASLGVGVASFLPVPVAAKELIFEPEIVEEIDPIEDMDDPILYILLTMPDAELMATLQGTSNIDLSTLGSLYPILCDRVARIADSGHLKTLLEELRAYYKEDI